MSTSAIVIAAEDNVATALEPIAAGDTVRAGAVAVTALDAIPRGHKIAIRAIPAGGQVLKYGNPIGTASADIAAGAHVHTHNVASTRGRGDLASGSAIGDRRSAIDNPQSNPQSATRNPQ
jgi:altronate dehydratase